MKKLLFVLMLCPTIVNAQKFELGLNAGVMTFTGKPENGMIFNNGHFQYTSIGMNGDTTVESYDLTTRKNISYAFSVKFLENLGKDWQIGLDISAYKVTYFNDIEGSTTQQDYVEEYSAPSIPITILVNRKINLPKSYIYLGGAFGVSLHRRCGFFDMSFHCKHVVCKRLLVVRFGHRAVRSDKINI